VSTLVSGDSFSTVGISELFLSFLAKGIEALFPALANIRGKRRPLNQERLLANGKEISLRLGLDFATDEEKFATPGTAFR